MSSNQIVRLVACGAVLCAAGVPLLVAQQAAHPDVRQLHLAEVRAKYDFEHWSRGARLPGFELGALALPGLKGGDVDFPGETRVTRSFADAQGVQRVLVEMDVFDSIDAGHAELLQKIASVSSTKQLPTTASKGWSTGDAGFIGYSGAAPDRIAWIAFATGNVAFRVVCLDPSSDAETDLGAVAVKVAQSALAATPIEGDAALPRPTIERFTLDRAQLALGQSAAIDLKIVDPLGRAARLEFEVGGPGQGYVENDAQGAPRFHATGKGGVTLLLRALGSNGTFATRSVSLEVTGR